MRIDRFTIDRFQKDDSEFLLIDHKTDKSITFSRKEARFLFCWLMQRLMVQEAFLNDGRRVTGFYQYDEVKNEIEKLEQSDISEKDQSGNG